MSVHTIHRHSAHCGWDHSLAPVLRIAPGESVEFEVSDASGGQLTPASRAADLTQLDFSRINPVNGPVYIDSAEPGDQLKVTVQSFQPSGWGWTGIIPGFGLLADEFPEPTLHIWKYEAATLQPSAFGQWGRVSLKPFVGTIGVAPAEPGMHSIVPPRRVGGNMDIRDLAAGSVLYLPLEVAGAALASTGLVLTSTASAAAASTAVSTGAGIGAGLTCASR